MQAETEVDSLEYASWEVWETLTELPDIEPTASQLTLYYVFPTGLSEEAATEGRRDYFGQSLRGCDPSWWRRYVGVGDSVTAGHGQLLVHTVKSNHK